MGCPDYNTFVAFVQGEISSEERAELRVHLDQCPTCFPTVVALAQEADPGEPTESVDRPVLEAQDTVSKVTGGAVIRST